MIHLKWYDEIEEHYFSVVDVVGILSESKNPSQYWRTLKSRLNDEGAQSVTICNRLKNAVLTIKCVKRGFDFLFLIFKKIHYKVNIDFNLEKVTL